MVNHVAADTHCGVCGEAVELEEIAHCQGCYDSVCGFCRVGSICLDCEAEVRESHS